MRLRIILKDETGNETLEYHASKQDLPKAEKWGKAFQTLFADAISEDADLDITITRKKGAANLYIK